MAANTNNNLNSLLLNSLAKDRLGHAYMFVGGNLKNLELQATKLAKTLNCQSSKKTSKKGIPLDYCGECIACRKVDTHNFSDLDIIRPESKSRVITVDQIRRLIQKVTLKPTEGRYKVAIISNAERMHSVSINAFLKTLEEPPDRTVFILLTKHPEKIIDTVLSRCLRLNFEGETGIQIENEDKKWLRSFVSITAQTNEGLMGRYRLLSNLLTHLTSKRDSIEETHQEASPINQHEDIDPTLRKKWEKELEATIESDYRGQRSQFLAGLQWWLRDVWMMAMKQSKELLYFQDWADESQAIARRIDADQALENLQCLEATQRLLETTNVQETLALEVGLLKLKL